MSIFNTVSQAKVGRNKFDLSYSNYLTARMGSVTPIMCQHLVPGDKFRVKSKVFGRLMPLANPTFQNLNVYTYYFFIPYRLVWDNGYDSWENFITSRKHPETGLLPTFPYCYPGAKTAMTEDDVKQSALHYLGYKFPKDFNSGANEQMQSALPIRAYWMLYNEWFRDQNVDFEVDVAKSGGEDSLQTVGTYPDGSNTQRSVYMHQMFKKRYHKDYFTSALPWPQLEEVTLPMAGYADIVSDGSYMQFLTHTNGGDSIPQTSSLNTLNQQASDGYITVPVTQDDAQNNVPLEYYHGLGVDMSGVTSATINDLRRAVALQHFYELSARGGNRYIEQMLAHFGVHSKDSRLQRPEFLGGGITPIQVGEVLQTSQTTTTADGVQPLGDMAGRGYMVNSETNGCEYYATEHGMLMAVMAIVPESLYWQGIDRHLQKFDPLDYYFPSFAHLGEQEIKNKELYYSQSSADEETFGYAPRYAEYKHNRNVVHGEFIDTLKRWHFGREFSATPDLSDAFLAVPNITNPFAVDDDSDKFLIQVNHQIDALRPMPYYSNPKLIG